jgi:hypothetical protein
MPDFLTITAFIAPFLSLGAFGYACWRVFFAFKREPEQMVKR